MSATRDSLTPQPFAAHRSSSHESLRGEPSSYAQIGAESVRDIEALGRVASVVGHELTNVLQILSSSVD